MTSKERVKITFNRTCNSGNHSFEPELFPEWMEECAVRTSIHDAPSIVIACSKWFDFLTNAQRYALVKRTNEYSEARGLVVICFFAHATRVEYVCKKIRQKDQDRDEKTLNLIFSIPTAELASRVEIDILHSF